MHNVHSRNEDFRKWSLLHKKAKLHYKQFLKWELYSNG